jgi:hypothetical protein
VAFYEEACQEMAALTEALRVAVAAASEVFRVAVSCDVDSWPRCRPSWGTGEWVLPMVAVRRVPWAEVRRWWGG